MPDTLANAIAGHLAFAVIVGGYAFLLWWRMRHSV